MRKAAGNNAWDLEIWKMALKNYRAPLLCYFRLFTFVAINSNSSDGPQTPTSGQNRRLFSGGTLKFYRWPWKTIGHLFYITASFVLHFITMCEIKLKLRPRNIQTGDTICFDLCDLDLWPSHFAWTLLLSMVTTPENLMMIRWQKHCEKGATDRQTSRQTDRQTDGQKCS